MTATPTRTRQVSPRGRITYFVPTEPHGVYRLFNARGILLYLGMSGDPDTRIAVHRSTQPWRAEIATWTVEWLPNRHAALVAEQVAIDAELPCYGRTTDLYRAVSDLTRANSSPTKRADLAALLERYRQFAVAVQVYRMRIATIG